MADLAPFGEEGFDPVAWVNAALAGRAAAAPGGGAAGAAGAPGGGAGAAEERFLAELEMRLQLAAEELEVSLAETSATALRRIPFAQQEVSRLQSDAASLASGVRSLLAAASADAAAAGAAAAPLAALDGVKSRMEAACATLREATELSGAFRQVEDLFSTGDLPRMAELLRSMGRSLALVGDVPEFREGKAKLAALEDRLQRRVEGRLADALEADDGAEVGNLARILLAVGRGATLEKLYCSSRAARASAAFDAAARPHAPAGAAGAPPAAPPAGAASLGGGALLAGYRALVQELEGQSAWLAGCLPEQRAGLVAALALAALGKVNKTLRERLTGLSSVPLLQALLCDALAGARGVQGVMAAAGAGGAAAGDALRAALEPLEEQVSRYSSMEDAALTSDLASCLGCDPTTSDLDAAAAALPAGVDAAFAALRGAAERCVVLSGGTELRSLIKVIDAQCQQYLTRLQAAAGVLHGRFAAAAEAAASGGAPGAVAAPPDLAAVLALVLVARKAGGALAALEASLRAAAATAAPRLAAAAAAGVATSAAARPPGAASQAAQASHAAGGGAQAALAELLPLRLAAFPGKLPPLERLAAQIESDPRFVALRASNAAASALFEGVSSLVYSALLDPVSRALAPLPALPAWPAAGVGGGGAAAAGPVPTFSAYPLPLVTGVGEYLMSLPGHLEVLMAEDDAGGGGDGGDELAAEWLDKAVRGAGLMYADAVMRIPALGAGGAAQLAADSEYFCNVMSALAVAPPPVLITVQVFAALPADQFSEAASAAVAEGSADAKVLRQLAAMRGGIGWEGGGGSGGGGGGGGAAGAAGAGGGAEDAGGGEVAY